MVCKYSGLPETKEKLTKTDVEDLIGRAKAFIEGSIKGVTQESLEESEQAVELANLIRNNADVIEWYDIRY